MIEATHHHADLFIFSGEQSGDSHGARLLSSLKQQDPSLRVIGVGGPEMRACEFECILEMEMFQVMGFSDVLLNLPRLRKLFIKTVQTILEKNPKVVVLIDYPDFNLRLASSLRKHGFQGKLVQYVCPSIWAWRKNRIHTMIDSLDLLLSIFPFEVKLFKDTPLQVRYIGNPTVEAIHNYSYKPTWLHDVGLTNPKHLMGIFPGSRRSEIKHNLIKQLRAAELLLKDDPQLQFGLSVANKDLLELLTKEIAKTSLKIGSQIFLIPNRFAYELMKDCRAAIATSGTVTLELGLHKTPTVVVYHVTPLNSFIAKYLFRLSLSNYCIVNIILEQRAFPELIHKDFDAQNLYRNASELYQDTAMRRDCIQKCHQLHQILEPRQSVMHPAEAISSLLYQAQEVT